MAVAVVIAIATFGAPPASAASMGAMSGAGTISPGLTATPTDQIINFSGTVTGVFEGVSGSAFCSFTGELDASTVVSGTGSGTASCSGSGISISCSFSLTLIFPPLCLLFNGTCRINAVTVRVTITLCGQYTSLNPATSYQVAGPFQAA